MARSSPGPSSSTGRRGEQCLRRLARRLRGAQIAAAADETIEPNDVAGIEVDERDKTDLRPALDADSEHRRGDHKRGASGTRIAIADIDEHRIISVVRGVKLADRLADRPVHAAQLRRQLGAIHILMELDRLADGAMQPRDLAEGIAPPLRQSAVVEFDDIETKCVLLCMEGGRQVPPGIVGPVGFRLVQPAGCELGQLDIDRHEDDARLSGRSPQRGNLRIRMGRAAHQRDHGERGHDKSREHQRPPVFRRHAPCAIVILSYSLQPINLELLNSCLPAAGGRGQLAAGELARKTAA